MSDIFHLNNAAASIDESPAFPPISGVRILAGKDDEGNAIVYEAGDDTWLMIEVENPWGSQAIANEMLARIQGYAYKPFIAQDALLNPAAELGDIVYVGGVYSIINSSDTAMNPIMPATISSPDGSNIDHEYPYETHESRQLKRSIKDVETYFTVELGKIESYVSENYETVTAAGEQYESLSSQITQTANSITQTVARTYQTKTAATTQYNSLSSQITQTANSITSTVSETYETKANATAKLNTAKSYADSKDSALNTSITAAYNSAITQMADSIKATVAAAETKYAIPSGVTISVYGYGTPPNSIASQYTDQYYLNQSNGIYYKSNGTRWVRQNSSALPLITNNLSSQITQTASSIRSEVSATYQTKSEANSDYSTLMSYIEQRADSITLSVSSSGGSTTFRLRDNGVLIDSETVQMTVKAANITGTLVAGAVEAGAYIESPNIIGGRFWDSSEEASLYLQYSGGAGRILYGAGNETSLSWAFWGVSGDYVNTAVDMYLAGHRILRASFSSSNIFAYGTWDFSSATVVGLS